MNIISKFLHQINLNNDTFCIPTRHFNIYSTQVTLPNICFNLVIFLMKYCIYFLSNDAQEDL